MAATKKITPAHLTAASMDLAEVAHAVASASAAMAALRLAVRDQIEHSMDEHSVEDQLANFRPYMV